MAALEKSDFGQCASGLRLHAGSEQYPGDFRFMRILTPEPGAYW